MFFRRDAAMKMRFKWKEYAMIEKKYSLNRMEIAPKKARQR
jgi:hypothetical protein